MAQQIPYAYVTRVELNNIRALKHLELDLWNNHEERRDPRMVSIIIGRNGTCKSTILRCIALAMCSLSEANALLSEPNAQLITAGMEAGSITIHFIQPQSQHIGKITLRLKHDRDRDTAVESNIAEHDTRFFACGYGAGRGGTGDPVSRRSYLVSDSVRGLFDYDTNLINPELTLRRLEDRLGSENYDRALKGIKRVLGLGPEHQIGYAKGGGISVSGPGIGSDVPLEGWADGYRMTFKWILDLYGRAIQADTIDDKGDIQGILLIDEIEQHLHPSMQSQLVTNLREALPGMQVFATTHSPLTALGTRAEDLIALHRRRSEVYRASVPSLTGFSAEDVLVEESLFGTNPYSEATQSKLDRYNQLKVKQPDDRTSEELEELQSLAADLDPGKLPATADDPVTSKLNELMDLIKKDRRA